MSNTTTHAIFDIGGTLLDSSTFIANLFNKYANDFGKELSPEVRVSIGEGGSANDMVNKFYDSIDLYDKAIRAQISEKFFKQLTNGKIGLMPGVDRLIKHLHKNNIPMALATNGLNRDITLFPEHFAYISKYFSHWVCGGDDPEVKFNKPNPDVYLICAKRFKTKPKSIENCVIFEDSLIGITGAVASGMKTILINDRKLINFDEIADKITVIIDSFNDFKPESIGLPAYESEL